MKILFFLFIVIIFFGALHVSGFVGESLQPAPVGVEPNISGNVNFEAGKVSGGNFDGELFRDGLQNGTGKNTGEGGGFATENIFWVVIGIMIFILFLVRFTGRRRKKDVF